jgi:hypothetical protein
MATFTGAAVIAESPGEGLADAAIARSEDVLMSILCP